MDANQTTCENCKRELLILQNTREIKCGPPVVKCAYCNFLNKTKMKLYRDFSLGERFLFWFSKGLLMPLYAMLMMVGGVFIIDWLYFTINEDGQSNFSYMLGISNWIGIIFFHAILALFLYLGIVQIKDTLSTKRQVREMEEIFDKNGGFFWSE